MNKFTELCSDLWAFYVMVLMAILFGLLYVLTLGTWTSVVRDMDSEHYHLKRPRSRPSTKIPKGWTSRDE